MHGLGPPVLGSLYRHIFCAINLLRPIETDNLVLGSLWFNHDDQMHVWRGGLVMDTRLGGGGGGQKVPGSSPGFTRSILNPWEGLCTGIPSPHSPHV